MGDFQPLKSLLDLAERKDNHPGTPCANLTPAKQPLGILAAAAWSPGLASLEVLLPSSTQGQPLEQGKATQQAESLILQMRKLRVRV